MKRTAFSLISSALLIAACAGGGSDAPTVELPVVISSGGLTNATTNLGYDVEVRLLLAAIRDVEFSIGGETHQAAASPSALSGGHEDWLYHPGHSQAGEVTGELRGDFIIDWTANGATIGLAEIIVGSYESVNFTFRRAEAGELPGDQPIVGHTFHIEGSADDGGGPIPFRALLDVDADTQMVGAPSQVEIAETTQGSLGLQVLTVDPIEMDTMFDDIDFANLPLVDDGSGGTRVDILPGQEPHNVLRRTVQSHDHYQIESDIR